MLLWASRVIFYLKKREQHQLVKTGSFMRSKPLADDAECPFVRNIFVIFSRITLSFKKKKFFPCLHRIYEPYGYKLKQTVGDSDMTPAICGRNTIHTKLNALDFHCHL
jgi:hypothetical protein